MTVVSIIEIHVVKADTHSARYLSKEGMVSCSEFGQILLVFL